MRITRTVVALASAAALTLTAAAPAIAAPDAELAKGKTTVVIEPDRYAFLAGAGVDIKPTGGAKAEAFGETVAAIFKITTIKDGGNVINHSGGLKLSLDGANIKVSKFRITLDALEVSGKTKGSEIGSAGRVPLFNIVETDDPELGAVGLELTDVAADAVNATFGTTFAEGDLFGYATPEPKS